MSENEQQFRLRRYADVNHEPGLVRQFMLMRQGLVGATPQIYMLADKFDYLKGNLDKELGLLGARMGRKLHPEHPFMPRPAVWHNELMRIKRKGCLATGSFKPDNLEVWEKEFLCLGMAFDENYIDADNNVWQRMFRIQMILKRGLQLPPSDQAFHDQIIEAIPHSIKTTYALV